MPTGRKHRWQEMCDSVLQEPDPAKALHLFDRALSALERRFAVLGKQPATKAELKAILGAISMFRQRFSSLQKEREG